MGESMAQMLTVGGKSNSLGKVNEVIELTLRDKSRLEELYGCLFDDDPWVRMRAADAIEKICRQHPDWLSPYIVRFSSELARSHQPSIQWHLAQIYRQVDLDKEQKEFAIQWLKYLLSRADIDWIVAANVMDTLAEFTYDGTFSKAELAELLKIQQNHKSSAVVRRATKHLAALEQS